MFRRKQVETSDYLFHINPIARSARNARKSRSSKQRERKITKNWRCDSADDRFVMNNSASVSSLEFGVVGRRAPSFKISVLPICDGAFDMAQTEECMPMTTRLVNNQSKSDLISKCLTTPQRKRKRPQTAKPSGKKQSHIKMDITIPSVGTTVTSETSVGQRLTDEQYTREMVHSPSARFSFQMPRHQSFNGHASPTRADAFHFSASPIATLALATDTSNNNDSAPKKRKRKKRKKKPTKRQKRGKTTKGKRRKFAEPKHAKERVLPKERTRLQRPQSAHCLSAAFASDTPRIFNLNKLFPNTVCATARTANEELTHRVQPKKRKPVMLTAMDTSSFDFRSRNARQKRVQKQSRKLKRAKSHSSMRPISAPSRSRRSKKQLQSAIRVESDRKREWTKQQKTQEQRPEQGCAKWNVFVGNETSVVIDFLESVSRQWSIPPALLAISRECDSFKITESAVETAWNAWNIIKRFLVPKRGDRNQYSMISSDLRKSVLQQYKVQSRNLDKNEITGDIFDQVLEEIGYRIGSVVGDIGKFEAAFETFLFQEFQRDACTLIYTQTSSYLDSTIEEDTPTVGGKARIDTNL